MKALIVEDEKLAANRLINMLVELDETIDVLDVLDSIESSVAYLRDHPAPDLIFMDIELGDGKSFEILEQVPINSYIIFITAFDEYAIRAFKFNSIDYILKPLKKEDLQFALQKFRNTADSSVRNLNLQNLLREFRAADTGYKTRFLVKKATRLISVDAEEVALIYTKGRVNFIKTFDANEYIIDNNLDELETQLDPTHFFRVNRQFITHYKAIDKIFSWFDGKLKLSVQPAAYEDIIISRLKANAFKKWLGK